LPGSTEPLPGREGLDSVAVAVKHGKPLERMTFAITLLEPMNLGDRSWGQAVVRSKVRRLRKWVASLAS
jgi:hypothetical protein